MAHEREEPIRASEILVSTYLTDVLSYLSGKVLHKQTVDRENNVVDVSGMPSGHLIFSLQNTQKMKVLKK
jgi:hypothetical protein